MISPFFCAGEACCEQQKQAEPRPGRGRDCQAQEKYEDMWWHLTAMVGLNPWGGLEETEFRVGTWVLFHGANGT